MIETWIRRAGLALSLALAASVAAAAAPTGGPRELIVTYRADPANRIAFRAYLQGEGIATLRKLKASGAVTSCEILFNKVTQPSTFDAMTIVSFRSYEDSASWARLEETMPGGLSPAGLRLAKPSATYSADLEWQGQSAQPGPASDHVYYVIPYTYGAADAYRAYVDGYVIPQVKGWMQDGALSRYRLFMNRYPVGDPDPWDSLFVYEYRDLHNFGRREEVLAKVRGPLRNDPVWAKLHETKATMRSENENTIMSHLATC